MTATEIDGFYAGYMTGAEGTGLAFFTFSNGRITGTDLEGVLFDGMLIKSDESNYVGTCKVKVPPEVLVIQGVTTGPQSLTYETPVVLPIGFGSETDIRVETPLGPVNLRLHYLRDLGLSNDAS